MNIPSPSDENDDLMPYAEMSEEAYAELAAASFSGERIEGGSVVLRGPCPRCGHIMEYLISAEVVKSALPWPLSRLQRASRPGAGDAGTETLTCQCEAAHPHRPQNFLGCGASWRLGVTES